MNSTASYMANRTCKQCDSDSPTTLTWCSHYTTVTYTVMWPMHDVLIQCHTVVELDIMCYIKLDVAITGLTVAATTKWSSLGCRVVSGWTLRWLCQLGTAGSICRKGTTHTGYRKKQTTYACAAHAWRGHVKSRDEILDIPDSLSMIFSYKYSYVAYICKSRCAGHINKYLKREYTFKYLTKIWI